MSETLILTKRWGKAGSATLASYRADGGYAALDKALGLDPAAIVDELEMYERLDLAKVEKILEGLK